MHLQAPHCPACGAPIDVPVGAERVTCGYCAATLVVAAQRVTTHHPPPATVNEQAPETYREPEASLLNWQTSRFELSLIEQLVEGAVPEIFAGFEVGDERFAFVSARVVDRQGHPVSWPLDDAFAALKTSLENDQDPGLAANLALEALCARPFDHRFECAMALFDPKRMRVTPYAVGAANAITWASSEEGRGVTLANHHGALERKSLRERGSQFENGSPVLLGADDVVVFASPGFLGRGARHSTNAAHALHQTLNEHLGEAPLRVVTLAKNAFWADRHAHARSAAEAPVGHVKIVAVRPVPPALQTSLPEGLSTRAFTTRQFEVAALVQPTDQLELRPLHDDREVVLWAAGPGVTEAVLATVRDAVLAVLDRRDHGDNENPREAGRRAVEAVRETHGPTVADSMRLAVIQLFEKYRRVKYSRFGWQQPLALGPRGGRQTDSLQQFDQGGEATVSPGARLFFAGALRYDLDVATADQLAELWPGGKASRLIQALHAHWKTKRTPAALESLARAARSDEGEAELAGMALVTGIDS